MYFIKLSIIKYWLEIEIFTYLLFRIILCLIKNKKKFIFIFVFKGLLYIGLFLVEYEMILNNECVNILVFN